MVFINVTCSEIQTPVGYRYQILPDLLNYTNNTDCKQKWCLEDWCLIADSAFPWKWLDPVISVSPDHLVTSRCINLIHEISCRASQFSRVNYFRARNQTEVTPNADVLNEVTPDLQLSDQWWWVSVLTGLLLLLLLLLLVVVLLRKRIFRRFQRETGVAGI